MTTVFCANCAHRIVKIGPTWHHVTSGRPHRVCEDGTQPRSMSRIAIPPRTP